jgi:ferredoxin-NADP reductase
MSDPTVAAIIHQMRLEAPHIISLELRPADANKPFFPAQAGAHIDLHLADALVRSYSLVHPSPGGKYTVAVLRDRNSRGGSRHVHEQLRVGQTITIGQPRNHFALQEEASASVLIAGGIGITPVYAMLQRLAELKRPARLIYCARCRSEAAYVDEIAQLVAAHSQLSVDWHWDDEKGGPPDLGALLAGTPVSTHLYACGPAPLLDAFESACARLGLPHAHLERFAAPAASTSGEAVAYTVELKKSGQSVLVPAGANLLDTLLASGLNLSHSCKEGICGACETKVLAGEVEHLDGILTKQEQAANKSMMICVSRCRSSRLVLDA